MLHGPLDLTDVESRKKWQPTQSGEIKTVTKYYAVVS
jgi:hypothetical protein